LKVTPKVEEMRFATSLKVVIVTPKFALCSKLKSNNNGIMICKNLESNNEIWKKLENNKLDGGNNYMLDAWSFFSFAIVHWCLSS
jgi:hypothetical protein